MSLKKSQDSFIENLKTVYNKLTNANAANTVGYQSLIKPSHLHYANQLVSFTQTLLRINIMPDLITINQYRNPWTWILLALTLPLIGLFVFSGKIVFIIPGVIIFYVIIRGLSKKIKFTQDLITILDPIGFKKNKEFKLKDLKLCKIGYDRTIGAKYFRIELSFGLKKKFTMDMNDITHNKIIYRIIKLLKTNQIKVKIDPSLKDYTEFYQNA